MPRPFYVYRRTSSARKFSLRRTSTPYPPQGKKTPVKGSKVQRKSSSSTSRRRSSRSSRGSSVTETAFNLAAMSLDLHKSLTGNKIKDLQKKLREALAELDMLNEQRANVDSKVKVEAAANADGAKDDSGLGLQANNDSDDEVFLEPGKDFAVKFIEPEKEKNKANLTEHSFYKRKTLSGKEEEEAVKVEMQRKKEAQQVEIIREMNIVDLTKEVPSPYDEIFVSEEEEDNSVIVLGEPQSPDNPEDRGHVIEDLVSTTDVSDDNSSIILSSDEEGPKLYGSDAAEEDNNDDDEDNNDTRASSHQASSSNTVSTAVVKFGDVASEEMDGPETLEEKLDALMKKIKAMEEDLTKVTLSDVKELSIELNAIERRNDGITEHVNEIIEMCHDHLQMVVDTITSNSVNYVVLGDGLARLEDVSDFSEDCEDEEDEQDHENDNE